MHNDFGEGFIDIHSHTLWGIDDGAADIDETLDMCECAEDTGTSTLILTPHLIYWDSAEELCDKRDAKAEWLCEELDGQGSDLIIKKGFEILCDDEIFNIRYFRPYTLNESRYILIEFDFYKTHEADVASWCRYLSSFGLVPVIAHPERYDFVIKNISCLDKLSEQGVLFQVNAGSPVGVFGDDEMYVSCKMLEAGYVDFFGSDAHGMMMRNTDMLTFFEDFPHTVSAEEIDRIARINPLAILNDAVYKPQRKKYLSEM